MLRNNQPAATRVSNREERISQLAYNSVHVVQEVLVGGHVVGVGVGDHLEDDGGDVGDRLAQGVRQHADGADGEEEETEEAQHAALGGEHDDETSS